MRILVIGSGYVGLVSGACFAEMGHEVICLDYNEDKIRRLKKGEIPIYEPGLEEMIKRNTKSNRLSFTSDYASSVPSCQVCIIAVDTPATPQGSADTTNVERAAVSIAQHMEHKLLIVTKSTVPVGTAHRLTQIISSTLEERRVDIPFDVISNPEFLKEGNAIQDFMKPDRVIVGVDNPEAIPIIKEIYSAFMFNHERLFVMDTLSAELAKYAANAMLAVRISFMNEMAALCEKIGANVDSVRKAIGSDHRIGHHFLYTSPGYGGSCFPKDVKAIQSQAHDQNCSLTIIKAADLANDKQKRLMGQKVVNYYQSQGGVQGKVIAILGLSFKPDTDDMREASSLVLIHDLLNQGAILHLYDPVASQKAKALLPDHPSIHWCNNEIDAATGADAIVLMTEWKQFRFMNFEILLAVMKGIAFFDGRNQYLPNEMALRGFNYISIGRPPAYAQAQAEQLKGQE